MRCCPPAQNIPIPASLKASSELEQRFVLGAVGRAFFWWLSLLKQILLPSHAWGRSEHQWLWKPALSPAARIQLCLRALPRGAGGRGLFWFVFCSLKALKRRVICCSVIKAFLHLFDFGSWCAISFFPGKCFQKVLESERAELRGKLWSRYLLM